MLTQAYDYLEECRQLRKILNNFSDKDWNRPTQFKDWTANDVIGHLHLFDVAADKTLNSADELQAFLADINAETKQGKTLVDYTSEWMGCQGEALLERWFSFAEKLADRYSKQTPSRRVEWGGPSMSVRSCISARQMETWSHGQALFDLAGANREESDRLYNIAIMGINTFGWTYISRKLDIPEIQPHVKITAPSGAIWEWNEGHQGLVSGSAVEFCQVVTQTRNVLDTNLHMVGDVANQWMQNAQCFAGPAEPPPKPGSRFSLEPKLKETSD